MAEVWFDEDAAFIGAFGIDSMHGFAEAIRADSNLVAVFGFDDEDEVTVDDIVNGEVVQRVHEVTVDDIVNALDYFGVQVLDIDDDVVREEVWPDESVHDSQFDVAPVPGTTRVIGVAV